jgi:hypothetical protein
MPREVLVSSGQDAPNQPGRGGVDVTVGAHETFGDRPYPRHDAVDPGTGGWDGLT